MVQHWVDVSCVLGNNYIITIKCCGLRMRLWMEEEMWGVAMEMKCIGF